jgi:cell division septal protein FtsQ
MARARKTKKRRTTTAAKRRRTTRRKKKSDTLINFIVPLFLMVSIVACLGLVLFFGFRSVAASSFFEVEEIETSGLHNVSRKSIETAVRAGMAGRGVWEADLEKIKFEIDRIDFVRHVSVSRVLPKTIRVIVAEREPVGLVRSNGKTYRVDRDGQLLGSIEGKTRDKSNFVMLGWDSDLSDEAIEANKKRLDVYLNLKEEWKRYDLSERVIAVDLRNLRSVEVVISESGKSVTLMLGSEEFGSRLKEGIKHAAGNGKRISKIILDRASPVMVYRD